MQIQTSPSSANITVSKPDDITGGYWEYDDNGTNGYLNKGKTTFTEKGGNTLTSITNFKPGYKATYLVKVKGSTTFTLTLSGFTAGVSASRKLLNANGTDSGTNIAAAHGMNIYSKAYTEESHSSYLSWVDDTASASDANSVTYDKFKYDGAITSAVINNEATAADTSTYAWIYFTVTFDDHAASRYTEYDGIGGSVLGYDGDDNDGRFFKQDDSGNSNCFVGLSFAITSITVGM